VPLVYGRAKTLNTTRNRKKIVDVCLRLLQGETLNSRRPFQTDHWPSQANPATLDVLLTADAPSRRGSLTT